MNYNVVIIYYKKKNIININKKIYFKSKLYLGRQTAELAMRIQS